MLRTMLLTTLPGMNFAERSSCILSILIFTLRLSPESCVYCVYITVESVCVFCVVCVVYCMYIMSSFESFMLFNVRLYRISVFRMMISRSSSPQFIWIHVFRWSNRVHLVHLSSSGSFKLIEFVWFIAVERRDAY